MNASPTVPASLAALLAQQTELAAAISAAKESAIADARAAVDTIVAERAAVVANLATIDANLAAARANLAALLPPVVVVKARRTSSPAAVNAAPNEKRDKMLAALTDGPKTTAQLKEAIGDDRGSNTDYWVNRLQTENLIHKAERGVYVIGPNPNAPTDQPAA